jgi:protein-disulfide isomerase
MGSFSESAPSRTTRRRRAAVPVAVAVAATVAAIVLSFAAGARDANLAAAAARMQRQIARIPQHGAMLGKPSAPVTVVEFADLQCPFCASYMLSTFPKLLADDVAPGKVKMVLNTVWLLGRGSARGAAAAASAAAQNKMWSFADAFYYSQGSENSGYITDRFLRQIGSQVPGLAVGKMMLDRRSSSTTARLKAMHAVATSNGIYGTPTFIVQDAAGQRVLVVGSAKLEAAIDQALAGFARKSSAGQNVE